MLQPALRLYANRAPACLTLVVVLALSASSLPLSAESKDKSPTIYDFSLVDASGKLVPLSTYKGKVMLIVNLAPHSAYRDQVSALNEIQKAYSAQGLVILGIPSEDFGGAEKKGASQSDPDQKSSLQADFPVFAPAKLRGVQTIPLYKFLCDSKLSVGGGDLHWSYTKFIIDRDGKPLARYEVDQDPADLDFHLIIESALAGKLKAKSADKKADEKEKENDDDD